MNDLQMIALIIGAFTIANIINTYFLTSKKLNRYIAPFRHTLKGETNAVLGNFGMLLLLSTIGILIFDNLFGLTIYLICVSLFLNIFFYLLGVYNLYYGNAFSRTCIEMFKNPTNGFVKGLIGEILAELVTYYRIVLFLPTLLLIVLFYSFSPQLLTQVTISFEPHIYVILILIAVLMCAVAYLQYLSILMHEAPIESARGTFAIQNYGVYPYYVFQFALPNVNRYSFKIFKAKNEDQLIEKINKYNKNQAEYTNYLDGGVYHNETHIDELGAGIYIDKSILKTDSLKGLLKGRNLVLIQMESMNDFLFHLKCCKEKMPFLETLLKESVYFENFYTSVGLGVSSDAEVSALTGLYPNGTKNFYWDNFNRHKKVYNEINNLTSLPKYFNFQNYKTMAFHGDQKKFYNREYVYQHLLPFNQFYSLESFDDKVLDKKVDLTQYYRYQYDENQYHISPWVSDYHLFNRVAEFNAKEQQNHFYYPITMMPHIPFEYYPRELMNNKKLNLSTKKYLSFADYYDDFIKRLFIDHNGQLKDLNNAVYLFYGDHGSGLKNGDIFKLFNKNKKNEPLFERMTLQKIACFLYVPGEKQTNHAYPIYKGLIKGRQPLLRGQIDIYRTIIELFDLNCRQDIFFGVNLLSKEKTFVLDNKLLDVAVDEAFFSLRNPQVIYPNNHIVSNETLKVIKETKLIHDLFFNKPGLQEKINQKLNNPLKVN